MKLINSIAAVFLLSIIMQGCSTPAYVQQDEGINLSQYKTYMWVDTRSAEDDESKRATEYADIGVHNAVNRELRSWNWSEVSDNPDAYISYDVFVERGVQNQQEAVYSEPYTRYYYNRALRRWSTIYYPSQFIGYQQYQTPVKEGTVTITIMDAKTDKKIWQGWTTERLSSSGISDLDIQRSIRNIFKQVK